MSENDRCLRSWRSAKPGEVRHEHTREVVREEKLPDWFAERLAAVEARIKLIEDRPTPLVPKLPDNDASQVPRAFGDFFERVLILEKQIFDLQEQNEVVVDDGSEDLTIAVSDLTATAMKMFAMMQGEIELIRRRVNKLDNDQMELVCGLREFAALESRRA